MALIECPACKRSFQDPGDFFENVVTCPHCDTIIELIFQDEDDEFEELQGDIDDFGPQYFDSHQEHNPLIE